MNGIFFITIILSVAALLFFSPEGVLAAMLSGGERAFSLTVTMVAVYAVWLGILSVAESSGVTAGLARILKKPVRLLFGKTTDKAEEYIAMNLSANLLGMGGVATPMGIAAAEELDKNNCVYAMNMLFVLAATSIQLLPTTVISLRGEAGSASAGDIILPSLIATLFSTITGVVSLMLFARKKQ